MGREDVPVNGALERLSWLLRDTRHEEERTAARKAAITHCTNGRKRSGAPRVGRTRHKVRKQLENATYPSRSVIICRKQRTRKRRIRNVVILRKVNNIQNSLNQTISLRSRSQSPACKIRLPASASCASVTSVRFTSRIISSNTSSTTRFAGASTGVLSGVFAGVTGVVMFRAMEGQSFTIMQSYEDRDGYKYGVRPLNAILAMLFVPRILYKGSVFRVNDVPNGMFTLSLRAYRATRGAAADGRDVVRRGAGGRGGVRGVGGCHRGVKT